MNNFSNDFSNRSTNQAVFINEKEAAQRYSISIAKLQQDRFHRKGFPYAKHGNRVLYNVTVCDEYLMEKMIYVEGNNS
ncbi:hypothetical protein [Desulforegula conservatrix]|uniref:hypothetical protein n=1 Tax=Desulforegula conservatrix TaxID=153026 RepID=UPI0003F59C48|nr:hypothetical protein [Desulforegula conservatrix]